MDPDHRRLDAPDVGGTISRDCGSRLPTSTFALKSPSAAGPPSGRETRRRAMVQAGDRRPRPSEGASVTASQSTPRPTDRPLQAGVRRGPVVHHNLAVPALYEAAIQRDEGVIAAGGPLVVRTGMHTGRSPKDKFVVDEPASREKIWWGEVNRPISEEHFERMREKVIGHLAARETFVKDAFVGAHPRHRRSVRVTTETRLGQPLRTQSLHPPDGRRAGRPSRPTSRSTTPPAWRPTRPPTARARGPSSSSTSRGARSSSAVPPMRERSRSPPSRS